MRVLRTLHLSAVPERLLRTYLCTGPTCLPHPPMLAVSCFGTPLCWQCAPPIPPPPPRAVCIMPYSLFTRLQFNVGHLETLETARTALKEAKWDGFMLSGNYVAGAYAH